MANQSLSLMNSPEVKQCPTELTSKRTDGEKNQQNHQNVPIICFVKEDLENTLKNSDRLKGKKIIMQKS